ncbi:MAG: RDD family protein [Alcanivoracaceae bacterium]|nr:RDD family protein [Alcanivoracaceae bacterium]
MQFLPVELNGIHIYATFIQRLGAGLIDTIILLTIIIVSTILQNINFNLAAIIELGVPIIFLVYSVFFNATHGGTIGKLLVGIQITKINGTRISYKESFKRSSVDILLTLPLLAIIFISLTKVNQNDFLIADIIVKDELLRVFYPSWKWMINRAIDIWFWSEFLVLLMNKRRRALHDFIAGTIVIKKSYVITLDKAP